MPIRLGQLRALKSAQMNPTGRSDVPALAPSVQYPAEGGDRTSLADHQDSQLGAFPMFKLRQNLVVVKLGHVREYALRACLLRALLRTRSGAPVEGLRS